jgi:hypothetical protein
MAGSSLDSIPRSAILRQTGKRDPTLGRQPVLDGFDLLDTLVALSTDRLTLASVVALVGHRRKRLNGSAAGLARRLGYSTRTNNYAARTVCCDRSTPVGR